MRNTIIMKSIEASINKKAGVYIKGSKRTKKDVEARMVFARLMKANAIGVTEISKYLGKSTSSIKYYIHMYDDVMRHDDYWSSMYEIHQVMIDGKGGNDLTLLLFIKDLQKKNKQLNLELKSIKKELRCTE